MHYCATVFEFGSSVGVLVTAERMVERKTTTAAAAAAAAAASATAATSTCTSNSAIAANGGKPAAVSKHVWLLDTIACQFYQQPDNLKTNYDSTEGESQQSKADSEESDEDDRPQPTLKRCADSVKRDGERAKLSQHKMYRDANFSIERDLDE
jgi:hypothetical protein